MGFRVLLIFLVTCIGWPANAAHADNLDIREWLVPWKKSQPHAPYVDKNGRVWFIGQKGSYIGNLSPAQGDFNRYDLLSSSGLQSLIVDAERTIWYSASRDGHIGKLSPSSGQSIIIAMPSKKAKDPHNLTFDTLGNIWFTVHKGNFIGKLRMADNRIELIQIATKKARPDGIVVDGQNNPWAAASGSNKLLQVFPSSMTIAEIDLPNKDARPRSVVTSTGGDVWYVDYELGELGRYHVLTNDFTQWSLPGGKKSEPIGMAIDKNDRIWVVETGERPNRIVGFDIASESFINETNIPSGGDSVRHMYYHEASGEVWFGADSNYVGRAKVH